MVKLIFQDNVTPLNNISLNESMSRRFFRS